jgi:hypothetical protein
VRVMSTGSRVYTGDGSFLDLGSSCLRGLCPPLRPGMVLMPMMWIRGVASEF